MQWTEAWTWPIQNRASKQEPLARSSIAPFDNGRNFEAYMVTRGCGYCRDKPTREIPYINQGGTHRLKSSDASESDWLNETDRDPARTSPGVEEVAVGNLDLNEEGEVGNRWKDGGSRRQEIKRIRRKQDERSAFNEGLGVAFGTEDVHHTLALFHSNSFSTTPHCKQIQFDCKNGDDDQESIVVYCRCQILASLSQNHDSFGDNIHATCSNNPLWSVCVCSLFLSRNCST